MKQKDVCEFWVWLNPGYSLGSIPSTRLQQGSLICCHQPKKPPPLLSVLGCGSAWGRTPAHPFPGTEDPEAGSVPPLTDPRTNGNNQEGAPDSRPQTQSGHGAALGPGVLWAGSHTRLHSSGTEGSRASTVT